MASRKKKKKKRSIRSLPQASPETNLGETMTIAWTVTVTTLLLCNLTNAVVYFYVNSHPEAAKMKLLQELLLVAGAIVGILSLLLIPVVYRVRQVPPPRGLVVFGVGVAAASILALLVRILA